MGGEQEPGQHADHEREDAVGVGRARDHVVDVPAAERLQRERPDRGQEHAGQQFAERLPRGRPGTEADEEHDQVDDQRERQRGEPLGSRADPAADGEPATHGGGNQDDRQDDQRRAIRAAAP